jgi:methyl-accepting chemotaxis protein
MGFVNRSNLGSHSGGSLKATRALEQKKGRAQAKQQQVGDDIASIASVILENAQEGVSAIEELKSSMEQVATAAEENSGASEQALKNVNNIKNNINAMNSTIDQAIANTLGAGTSVTNVVNSINGTVDRMVGFVNIAKDSVIKSEELKTASQSIGEAVGLIAEIADQTNLLALNAAIEASRAKEHGMGFAVVADEARNLAGVNETNAKHINDLVNGIQDSIDGIISDISSTATSIETTGNSGAFLSKHLEELVKITLYSVEAAKNASNFTNQLFKLSNEIYENSEKITVASSQIAHAVEITLNGIDLQVDAMNQNEEDIKELTSLASEIKYSNDPSQTTEDIASNADSLSDSIEKIQTSMQDVSKALTDIETQTKSTNEAAIKNKEKAELAVGLSTDIDAIIDIIRRNFDILKHSFQQVKNSLGDIKSNVNDSTKKGVSAKNELGTIKNESRNVSKTVRKISNSITQLNMLAISGSIEAARVGEHGKGFAVVSADIRTLAQDSDTNIEKITDIVEIMNGNVESADKIWNNLIEGQEHEQANIDSLIVQSDEIMNQLVDVLDRYQKLKNMNDQNLEGLNQALGGIDEIQKAIELSATNSLEARKASELIVETIENMFDGIEELVSVTEDMLLKHKIL